MNMKKRILSLVLALTMCASLIPAASAASLSTKSYPYTVTDEYIDSDIGKVGVTVKLDGYIGELDMKAIGIENELENGLGYTPDTASPSTSRPVYVVKAGSNVTFTINNSKGAYNFCYDNGVAPDEYGSIYVDAGGGTFYDGTSPELYPITMSPSRLSSGKVALNAAGIISVDTKKVNSNTYSYSAEDGLYTFAFTATDKVSGDEWWMADIMARYVIGTFLFISEEQVDQLKASGTMTFHKGLVCEYDRVYPGLAELLGITEAECTYGQATFKSRGYTIENDCGYLLIDVTNKTDSPDEGDLFYVLFNKYYEEIGIMDSSTEYLPTDCIYQIHYQVDANATTTIRMPTSVVLDVDPGDSGSWHENDLVESSRYVLVQAETPEECEELVEFFKSFHFYNEIQLDYEPVNGITALAHPAPMLSYKNRLDQKLGAFTSHF